MLAKFDAHYRSLQRLIWSSLLPLRGFQAGLICLSASLSVFHSLHWLWIFPLCVIVLAEKKHWRLTLGLISLQLVLVFWMAWRYPLIRNFPHPSDPSLVIGDTISGKLYKFSNEAQNKYFDFSTTVGRLRIHPANNCVVKPGEVIELRGKFRQVEGPRNPGQFNYPAYLRSENIVGEYLVESCRVTKEAPLVWRGLGFLRGKISSTFHRYIPSSQHGLVFAALLGDRSSLSNPSKLAFQHTGLIHVLAISGAHLGIIALILLQILGLLRIPRTPSYLLAGGILIAYAFLCNTPISVLRSLTMFLCLIPAFLLGRPGQSLNSLGLALAFCLLLQPYSSLSLGFQLSFAATFLLIFYSRPLLFLVRDHWGIERAILQTILIASALSVVISIGIFPILGNSLYQFSPISILGNIPSGLLLSAMLTSAILCLIFSAITILFPFVSIAAEAFGNSTAFFSFFLDHWVKLLDNLPASPLNTGQVSLTVSIVLLLCLICFPFVRKNHVCRFITIAGCLLLSFIYLVNAILGAQSVTRVTFLDVGQGDATLVQTASASFLIDAGAGPPFSHVGSRVVQAYCQYQGLAKLDLAIITHSDWDHFGGMLELMEAIPIGKIVLGPHDYSESKTWNIFLAKAKKAGIPIQRCRCGDSLYTSNQTNLVVLYPCGDEGLDNKNESSLVLRLESRGKNVLLTGDLGFAGEAKLLSMDWPNLDCDILKVGHHGSKGSNSLAFLKETKPELAIISAAKKNRYGHPHPELLARLQTEQIHVVSTPISGALQAELAKDGIRWKAFLSSSQDSIIKTE